MTTPVRVHKGHFNGSIGHGATHTPTPAPTTSTTTHDETAGTRPQLHTPHTQETNRGSIIPGTPYTGVTIFYRDQETGRERVEWTGELHGTWRDEDSGRDPATDLIASLRAAGDGALPHRVEFRAPSQAVANTIDVRSLSLVGGGFAEVTARAARARLS